MQSNPRGTLLLGPGHLGSPGDLSLRVVKALGGAALVVVETGSLHALKATLRALGIVDRPTAELPSSGFVPVQVAELVLANLDGGGDVLLFGVEEGIPGYADPGAGLIRLVRETRPDVPIRSLGGTSVIGAALLASGLGVDRVTLLGVTTAPEPQRQRKFREVLRWVRLLARPEHAVAVLAPGDDVRELAQRLDRVRWLEVQMVVCASLTLPDERVFSGTPAAILASPLAGSAPTTVLIVARLRSWHPRSWLAAVMRLVV